MAYIVATDQNVDFHDATTEAAGKQVGVKKMPGIK